MFEQYKHHGTNVWIRSNLKGKHREYCLCHSCKKLDVVNVENNCPIARAIYKNCVEFNLTTPVWECPEFLEDKQPKED